MLDWPLMAVSPTPVVDGVYLVNLLSRLAHTTCAGVLLGGLVYAWCVLAPAAASADDPAEALYRGRRGAWAACVAVASALLLVSGFYNYLVVYTFPNEKLPSTYHMLAGMKMLLGIAVMGLAAVLSGKTGAARALQRRAGRWLTVALTLTVLTYGLGAVLRTFPKIPKADPPGPAAAGGVAPQADGEPNPGRSDG